MTMKSTKKLTIPVEGKLQTEERANSALRSQKSLPKIKPMTDNERHSVDKSGDKIDGMRRVSTHN